MKITLPNGVVLEGLTAEEANNLLCVRSEKEMIVRQNKNQKIKFCRVCKKRIYGSAIKKYCSLGCAKTEMNRRRRLYYKRMGKIIRAKRKARYRREKAATPTPIGERITNIPVRVEA